MIARLLCIPDLHKRYSDGSSIKGQFSVQIKIQEDIISAVHELGATHILQLGDWYDRGFHGLCMAYGSMEMDRRISESVNGNVYITVGNHFYLERDENPEMYIIQPCDMIRPQYDIPLPKKPIFQMVPRIRLGNVQIDFFHYSKTDKRYYTPTEDGVTYHIGVYHDEMCVPAWVREQEGFHSVTTNQRYFNDIYYNIDLALHGHIHSAIGNCDVTMMNGRKVPLLIPGSLGIVQNKSQFKHPYVECPVITIDDDSTVTVALYPISTHMDELVFYETKKKEKAIEDTTEQIISGTVHMTDSAKQHTTLIAYLTEKGCSDLQISIMDAAIHNNLDFQTAVNLLCSREEI